MRFRTNATHQTPRDALLKPLATVSGIVERRHTLPILANILIRKEGARVSFVSTDIEVQIRTHADIGVVDGKDAENGATTVAARKLLDILRALPESGEVTISTTAKKMTVQSGKSRFNLQTLAADDFPTVSQPESYLASFSLPQKTLKHLIAHGPFLDGPAGHPVLPQWFAPRRRRRASHCGCDRRSPARVLRGRGRRRRRDERERRAAGSDRAAQEHPRAAAAARRRRRAGDDRPRAEPGALHVRQRRAVSKLVEGKFPDYQRVIPSGYSKSFDIARDAWLRALQRVAILTSDKFKGVRFVLSEDAVKISSTNADQEDAQDEIEIAYPHGTLDIGFNVSYLLDVLNNLKSEQVTVSVGDSNSSALITLPGEDAFKYVVMPMRI